MLSIIIVNYNVKYFLGQCLTSVKKAIRDLEAEIIVIDNNSTDGSVEYIASHFPDITIIANRVNLGFAKANNQGWKIAKGDFILFLNPDTLLSEECLVSSLAVFEQQPTVGALGIRMIDGSGRYLPESKRGLPTPAASFYKLSGLITLFPRSKKMAGYYMGHLADGKNHLVAVLAGAYMMVRKEVLQVTGGFDEQFFMYGEDVDLCYRIRQAGFTNYYLADSTIIHFKGESTRKDFKYVNMFYKAMRQFVKKHYRSQSGRFGIMLQIAISFRATLSYFGKLFSRTPLATSKRPPVNILIIGTAKEQHWVKEILKKSRATAHPPNGMTASEFASAVLSKADTDEIIFCSAGLWYQTIIKKMQDLPKGFVYRFYSDEMKSLVGSDSKKSSGEVMTL